MASLDESKIIDREAEAKIFDDMLRFQTPRRILVVSGKSGMGKSDLLRKLRFLCENVHGIPVALRDLREFENRPEVFPLVVSLHDALTDGGAEFPAFNARNRARADRDRSSLAERQVSAKGIVNLAGAVIKDSAKAAGVMTTNVFEHAENVYVGQPQWTEEHETEARSLCIDDFLADLLGFCRNQPAVVLFDSVDKAGEEVQRWVFLELIRRRLLPIRKDCRLIVVLAGHGVAEMLSNRLPPADQECIEPMAALSRWNENDVGDFLSAHGYDFRTEEIAAIHSLLSSGVYSLSGALVVAASIAGVRHP